MAIRKGTEQRVKGLVKKERNVYIKKKKNIQPEAVQNVIMEQYRHTVSFSGVPLKNFTIAN